MVKFDKPLKVLVPNIRIGKDGYTWGQLPKDSNILKLLNLDFEEIGVEKTEPLAEMWVVSDDSTFSSTVIVNEKEVLLSDFLKDYGRVVLGEKHFAKYGPYLASIMKLLDAEKSLSVQVHPAIGHPSRPPKPEMWLVESEVAPLYLGFSENVCSESLKDAYQNGELEKLLFELHAKKGDLILVDGGMVHAIRKGSCIWEWSHSPTGLEREKGDMKRTTVAAWDRTDGKAPRPGKEDIDGTIEVLNDAQNRAGKSVYEKMDLKKAICRKKNIYSDCSDNTVYRLFETSDVVVEEIIVADQLDFKNNENGFPIFVKSGKVEVCNEAGDCICCLKQCEAAIIPATLKNYSLRNSGKQNCVIFKWFSML